MQFVILNAACLPVGRRSVMKESQLVIPRFLVPRNDTEHVILSAVQRSEESKLINTNPCHS